MAAEGLRAQPAESRGDAKKAAAVTAPEETASRWPGPVSSAPHLLPERFLQLQRAAGNRATAQLFSPGPVAQRLPAAIEGLEVALTATITAQEQVALTQGGLHYESDKGSRLGSPPQPADHEYTATVLTALRDDMMLPDVQAVFKLHWQGNEYGEMGGAYVQIDLAESTEFHEHGSSLEAKFTVLDTMPKKGDDPRFWAMQWVYEGNFDPLGAGQWAFTGKFEIDAFGGFRVLEHYVRNDTTSLSFGRKAPEYYVRRGINRPTVSPILPPPPIPKPAK